MNASFEDVVEFDAILEEHKGDWETVFKTYSKTRKKDTDAIADLAIDNFHEMKDHVGQEIFQEKRKIEMALEKEFPTDYSSKYSLVTFNEQIGYREAMLKGRAQDKAILNMLSDGEISTNIDLKNQTVLKAVLEKVKAETYHILDDDHIAKTMHH
jgi:kynurenine 3-monooxygenase